MEDFAFITHFSNFMFLVGCKEIFMLDLCTCGLSTETNNKNEALPPSHYLAQSFLEFLTQ